MKDRDKNTFSVDGKLPALQAEGFMGRAFIRKDIAPILGLTGRTIAHYTDLGIVVPQIHNPSGKGTNRLYSVKNVFELLLIQLVIKHGIKLSDCKSIIVKATEQWMKNTQSKTITIHTRKGRSSPEKYKVRLYEKDNINLEIDLKDYESILILDLSDIIIKLNSL